MVLVAPTLAEGSVEGSGGDVMKRVAVAVGLALGGCASAPIETALSPAPPAPRATHIEIVGNYHGRDLRLNLNGETVATGENNTVLLPAPEAWDNVSEEGKAKLAEINEPSIDPLYPVSWYIEGLTDYTLEQMLACKGPGE